MVTQPINTKISVNMRTLPASYTRILIFISTFFLFLYINLSLYWLPKLFYSFFKKDLQFFFTLLIFVVFCPAKFIAQQIKILNIAYWSEIGSYKKLKIIEIQALIFQLLNIIFLSLTYINVIF